MWNHQAYLEDLRRPLLLSSSVNVAPVTVGIEQDHKSHELSDIPEKHQSPKRFQAAILLFVFWKDAVRGV